MELITKVKTELEKHFAPFREKIVGHQTEFMTPYGKMPLIYADWTASGRLYAPIEQKLSYDIGAFVGNTHTETSTTGTAMTKAYHRAKEIIKKHVNASESDVLISSNSGMTGVINKFQRILGLKLHERFDSMISLKEVDRPVVFVTHMEHHSNQTSWLETIADVVVIQATDDGLVDLDNLVELIKKYPERTKIAAVTSCSNVTGLLTPYHEIAKIKQVPLDQRYAKNPERFVRGQPKVKMPPEFVAINPINIEQGVNPMSDSVNFPTLSAAGYVSAK